MTIGRKIIGGYAALLVLFLVAVVTSSYTVSVLDSGYQELIDRRGELARDALRLMANIRSQVANYRGFLIFSGEMDAYWNALQANQKEFADLVEEMRRLVNTEEGRTQLEAIVALEARHEATRERVLSIAREGKAAEALALSAREAQPLTAQLQTLVDQFLTRQVQLEKESRRSVTATAARLASIRFAVFGLAVLVGAALAITMSRSIGTQLKEAVAQLASSSAEILATTSEVASSSAETATAVSETSSTAEEVKQTAHLSLQKAKAMSDTAQQTAQAAQTGKNAVEQAIAGMHHIEKQMASVAESIVRLSEQSQAVGEIIATVNDLADQSNLLAVNAAIEAAKAGEQGKGFGVVAQEVRSLADQSKQATAQIRTILGDIQKAVSAAVMATEQGNKAVEAGVKLSAEGGSAIQTLANSVAEAGRAATQIAASNQQQLAGMDQVALAMENIQQATAQNVAGTRQAEQAAQRLTDLGQRLRAMVEKERT